MIERRKTERFALSVQASVSVNSGGQSKSPVSLTTKDISLNGAYFMTPNPLPVGTKVDVDMLLKLGDVTSTGAKKALVKASGAVYRIDPSGMVIRFDEDSKILPFSVELSPSKLKQHGE